MIHAAHTNGPFANNSSSTLKSSDHRHHSNGKLSHLAPSSRLSSSLITVTKYTHHSSFILTTSTASPTASLSNSSNNNTISNSNNNGSVNDSLPSGTIVGIVCSVLSAVALVAFISFFFLLRKRRGFISNKNDISIHSSDLNESIIQKNVANISPSTGNDNNEKTSNTLSRNLKTHTVISSFTQTLDDELYIQPGDKVQINNEYDDGWCLGKNLTRGGARGVLPRHCLDI